MYKQSFGSLGQVQFDNESEYYELLGYLAKSDNSTYITWEDNDLQGAWGKEGRIEFHTDPPAELSAYLKHTAGNGGSVLSRVNCNEYVNHIVEKHKFVKRDVQNAELIKSTVPEEFHVAFDRGLEL
jgi:hypothetical protein